MSPSSKKKKTPLPKQSAAVSARNKIVQEEIEDQVNAKQEFILSEKELIPVHKGKPNLLFSNSPSKRWDWVLHVDWQALFKWVWDGTVKDLPASFRGFTKIHDIMGEFLGEPPVQDQEYDADGNPLPIVVEGELSNKEYKAKYKLLAHRMVLCPLCFKNPDVPLFKCCITCSDEKPSNVKQHIDKHHGGDEKVFGVSSEEKLNQSTLKGFTSDLSPRKEAVGQLRQLIYEFVNDCCLPANTVEKPQFRELLRYAFQNGGQLKDTRAEVMSRRQVTKLRMDSYKDYVSTVASLARNVREEYKTLCGKEIAFATVCHDIWQARRHDVLGVTLMFADPRNSVVYRIPIGLAETKGHAAVDVANLTHSLLMSVGFNQDDLVASVNDNTSAAVLAGKYIVGDHAKVGRCDMHRAELVLKHATGLVQRFRKGVLIDSFPEFCELYGKFKKLAGWVTSKHAFHRWEKLKKKAEELGFTLILIPMPNDTRVGGCVILIQALLRNKWFFDLYVLTSKLSDPTFVSLYPTQDEWDLLAQYEGILSPLKAVALQLQTDEPGASSATLLEIYLSHFKTERMRMSKVSCVPVNEADLEEDEKWDASAPMSELNALRIGVSYNELGDGPKKLIRRILHEYRIYLLDTDEDALKAVCCNPMLANIYDDMFQSLAMFDSEKVRKARRIFLDDMMSKFSNAKASPLGALLEKQRQQSQGEPTTPPKETTATPPTNPGNTGSSRKKKERYEEEDVFESIRRTRELKEQALLQITGAASMGGTETEVLVALKNACTEAFDSFKRMCGVHIDKQWAKVIADYPTEKYSNEAPKWNEQEKTAFRKACLNSNYCQISKYFDIMAWWSDHKTEFPLMYVMAMIWLTKPSTNAFQERIFSLGTWFQQNKLMANMLKKHYEMRTMDFLTRSLKREIIARELELQRNTKQQISHYVGIGNSEMSDTLNEAGTTMDSSTKEKAATKDFSTRQTALVQMSGIRDATQSYVEYNKKADAEKGLVTNDQSIGMTYFEELSEDEDERSLLSGGLETPEVCAEMSKEKRIREAQRLSQMVRDGRKKPIEWDTVKVVRFERHPDDDSVQHSSEDESFGDEDSDAAMNEVFDLELKGLEQAVVQEAIDLTASQTEQRDSDRDTSGNKRKTDAQRRKKTKQQKLLPTRQSPPRQAKNKSRLKQASMKQTSLSLSGGHEERQKQSQSRSQVNAKKHAKGRKGQPKDDRNYEDEQQDDTKNDQSIEDVLQELESDSEDEEHGNEEHDDEEVYDD